MPVRFFRFPWLVQKEILRSIDPFSIIVLSIMNKNLKRAIVAGGYPVDRWLWDGTDHILLEVRGEVVHIEILPNKREVEPDMLPLNLNNEKFVVRIEKADSVQELGTLLVESGTKISKTQKLKLRINEMISRHLYTFIRPVMSGFHWNDPTVKVDNLFVFDITKNFNYVRLDPDSSFFVSPDTAKMLMEDVTANKMELRIKTEKFKYECSRNQISKIKQLCLYRSDFLQFKNFIRNLNHPHVQCFITPLKTWNKILKEWVKENNNVIEYLMLFRYIMGFLEQEAVLDGLPHRPTRFKRNQLKSLLGEDAFYEEVMQSYDIKRVHDAREATLVFSQNTVTLYVWTDEQIKKIRNIHD